MSPLALILDTVRQHVARQRLPIAIASIFLTTLLFSKLVRRKVVISCYLPILLLSRVINSGLQWRLKNQHDRGLASIDIQEIDDHAFPDEREFEKVLQRVGQTGERITGSRSHNDLINWFEDELSGLQDITLESQEYSISQWLTKDGLPLSKSGELRLWDSQGIFKQVVPVAGSIPFSKPMSSESSPLIYVPRTVELSEAPVKGKIVLRDFPRNPIPYALAMLMSYSKTSDLNVDILSEYDRPGSADGPLDKDLVEAAKAGAVGMVVLFDIEQEQIKSYYEPHKGRHYNLPAAFVGVSEAIMLKRLAVQGYSASVKIDAEISTLPTRNLIATLPGQTAETIVYASHTDGNTYIQENGTVALLNLARYFANLPLSARERTIQFAFNSSHLNIAHEGSLRHAFNLSSQDTDGNVVLVVPVEHLGSREIEAIPRPNGEAGRMLRYSGRGEVMIWCIGPSPVVVAAVQQVVTRRRLDRVILTRGVNFPDTSKVPTFTSFGGLGGYYHNFLLPTASLISGPWSLWAPSFGIEAVDISRLRKQTLAIGDIYFALSNTTKEAIIAGYSEYRQRRDRGEKACRTLADGTDI